MHRPVRTRLGALALVAALLASCSSSASSTSSTTRAATPTTSGPTTTTAPVHGTARQYVAALLENYNPKSSYFSKDEVVCVAPKWVTTITPARFMAAGIAPAEIRSGKKNTADLHLAAPVAAQMVADLHTCKVDTRTLVIRSATGGKVLSGSQEACVNQALPRAAVDQALAATFRGIAPDPKLLDPAQSCFTGTTSTPPTTGG